MNSVPDRHEKSGRNTEGKLVAGVVASYSLAADWRGNGRTRCTRWPGWSRIDRDIRHPKAKFRLQQRIGLIGEEFERGLASG